MQRQRKVDERQCKPRQALTCPLQLVSTATTPPLQPYTLPSGPTTGSSTLKRPHDLRSVRQKSTQARRIAGLIADRGSFVTLRRRSASRRPARPSSARPARSAGRRPPPTCARAGWVGMLLLEWLRNAVQPPGSRTHPFIQPELFGALESRIRQQNRGERQCRHLRRAWRKGRERAGKGTGQSEGRARRRSGGPLLGHSGAVKMLTPPLPHY